MLASLPTRFVGVAIAASLLPVLSFVPAASGQGATWPRLFDSTSGTFMVYQPQPEQMLGNLVTARAAFALQKADAATATFGVLWFQAHVQVDRDSSTVAESDLDVTMVRLPGASDAEAKRYEQLVEAEATNWDLSGSFEELQAGLAASARERLSVENLDHTPPHVLFSKRRALLVVYDGDLQLEPIEGSRIQRVVNTPCAVVFDSVGAAYYLNGANLWYRAGNPLGPWSLIAGPPADVAAVVPPDTIAADQVAGEPPVVVAATEPTELIVTDGEPLLEPLVGDELFYVTNTESDVLRDVKTGSVYVLLSGRWFTARALDDPWVYVPADELPAIFKRIPASSARGYLLASVAGTDEADNAVADDQIPQTSAISRDDHDVSVEWDGQPQFEAIAGTNLQYGLNTDAQVLLAGGRYYLCDQGVWYVANDPNGPWSVSAELPAGLEDLPPSSPAYNLRYVEIYGVTPDFVEVGYLPGYLGYYPCRGTVVYGTGYRYRPWRSRRHYFPRPCTWGFHARYNPWLSRWSFGVSYWSGFLRVGLHWQKVSGPGQSRRTLPWLGPGGFHRPLLAADRSMLRVKPARVRVPDTTPMNLYTRSWNSRRQPKPGDRASRPRLPGAGRRAPVPDNVFAGRDGKVYQRAADGQWKVNEGRRWLPTPMPVAPVAPITPVGGSGDAGNVSRLRGDGRRPPEQPIPAAPVAPITPVGGSGEDPDGSRMRGDSQHPRVQPVPVPAQPAPVQPAPVEPALTPPAERSPAPLPVPPVRPAAPMPVAPAPAQQQPGASPGGLERDFRARERTSSQAPVVAPHAPARADTPPAKQPAKPARAPEKKDAPAQREK